MQWKNNDVKPEEEVPCVVKLNELGIEKTNVEYVVATVRQWLCLYPTRVSKPVFVRSPKRPMTSILLQGV